MEQQANWEVAMAKIAARPKKPLNRAKRMAAAPKKTAPLAKAAPVAKPAPRKLAAFKRTGSRKVKTVAVSAKDLAKSAKPSFFRMRTQLVDAGNTELPLAVGDNLWIKIKVYAEGGENHLHAHPYQDHSFIVLDGKACFHGPRGERRTLKRNDGVFLPAGSYYWFEQVGEHPLVVLRLGATKPGGHPDTRVMPDGSWQVRRGRAEVFKSKNVAYRKGAFYG
jgi:mannose-6-phosphate isomerase-like protein (cupin superfamily)